MAPGALLVLIVAVIVIVVLVIEGWWLLLGVTTVVSLVSGYQAWRAGLPFFTARDDD